MAEIPKGASSHPPCPDFMPGTSNAVESIDAAIRCIQSAPLSESFKDPLIERAYEWLSIGALPDTEFSKIVGKIQSIERKLGMTSGHLSERQSAIQTAIQCVRSLSFESDSISGIQAALQGIQDIPNLPEDVALKREQAVHYLNLGQPAMPEDKQAAIAFLSAHGTHYLKEVAKERLLAFVKNFDPHPNIDLYARLMSPSPSLHDIQEYFITTHYCTVRSSELDAKLLTHLSSFLSHLTPDSVSHPDQVHSYEILASNVPSSCVHSYPDKATLIQNKSKMAVFLQLHQDKLTLEDFSAHSPLFKAAKYCLSHPKMFNNNEGTLIRAKTLWQFHEDLSHLEEQVKRYTGDEGCSEKLQTAYATACRNFIVMYKFACEAEGKPPTEFSDMEIGPDTLMKARLFYMCLTELSLSDNQALICFNEINANPLLLSDIKELNDPLLNTQLRFIINSKFFQFRILMTDLTNQMLQIGEDIAHAKTAEERRVMEEKLQSKQEKLKTVADRIRAIDEHIAQKHTDAAAASSSTDIDTV